MRATGENGGLNNLWIEREGQRERGTADRKKD